MATTKRKNKRRGQRTSAKKAGGKKLVAKAGREVNDKLLREPLSKVLGWREAHADWKQALAGVDPAHRGEWPAGYWPKTLAPADDAAWEKSVRDFFHDLKEMEKLASNPRTDLFARIKHGTGQTFLRQVLLLIDHNSYHLGQLVLVRRLLNAW